jgi:hypothetical protein
MRHRHSDSVEFESCCVADPIGKKNFCEDRPPTIHPLQLSRVCRPGRPHSPTRPPNCRRVDRTQIPGKGRSDDPVAVRLRPVVISLKYGGASVHRERCGHSNFVIG